jgi:hypothetical protein
MTGAATSNQFDALKPVQAFSPSVINFLQGQASYIAYVSQVTGISRETLREHFFAPRNPGSHFEQYCPSRSFS